MHSPWHWMKGVAILLTLTSHNQFLKSIYVQYYKIRNLSTLDAQKLLIQVWFFTNSKEWKIRFLLNWEGKTISVPTIFKVWNYLGCTFVQFVYLKFIKIKIFMPLNLIKIQILMMLLSEPNQNLLIQMDVTLQICMHFRPHVGFPNILRSKMHTFRVTFIWISKFWFTVT